MRGDAFFLVEPTNFAREVICIMNDQFDEVDDYYLEDIIVTESKLKQQWCF